MNYSKFSRILLKKYDNLTSVEFLLKTYDQYLEEIISILISSVNGISVLQYNITFNCKTDKGVLKIDLSSISRWSSISYSYLKVKYDEN